MEVEHKVSEASLGHLKCLTVRHLLREEAAAELLELFDEQLALGLSHYLRHRRSHVYEPLTTELLQPSKLPQFDRQSRQ